MKDAGKYIPKKDYYDTVIGWTEAFSPTRPNDPPLVSSYTMLLDGIESKISSMRFPDQGYTMTSISKRLKMKRIVGKATASKAHGYDRLRPDDDYSYAVKAVVDRMMRKPLAGKAGLTFGSMDSRGQARYVKVEAKE